MMTLEITPFGRCRCVIAGTAYQWAFPFHLGTTVNHISKIKRFKLTEPTGRFWSQVSCSHNAPSTLDGQQSVLHQAWYWTADHLWCFGSSLQWTSVILINSPLGLRTWRLPHGCLGQKPTAQACILSESSIISTTPELKQNTRLYSGLSQKPQVSMGLPPGLSKEFSNSLVWGLGEWSDWSYKIPFLNPTHTYNTCIKLIII